MGYKENFYQLPKKATSLLSINRILLCRSSQRKTKRIIWYFKIL